MNNILSSLYLFVAVAAYSWDWSSWKDFHNKKYSSELEENHRYIIWTNNLKKINMHNSNMSKTFTMGLNKFSDLTFSEFKAQTRCGSYFPTNICDKINNQTDFSSQPNDIKFTNNILPSFVDWRIKGAVTPVKDQEQCGSCWAFSAIGSLESIWQISTGKLYNLSEQQLVDCSWPEGNYGCSGGLMDYAFNYTKLKGMCSSDEYPYWGQDFKCDASTCKHVVKTKGCANIWTGDLKTTENLLNYVVAQHPVSIVVSASDEWMGYSQGIINNTSCNQGLDHGVVIVGYNRTTDGSGYWIVKNSWGTKWGINGYIYLSMDNNMCGLASDPSFPILQ